MNATPASLTQEESPTHVPISSIGHMPTVAMSLTSDSRSAIRHGALPMSLLWPCSLQHAHTATSTVVTKALNFKLSSTRPSQRSFLSSSKLTQVVITRYQLSTIKRIQLSLT